MTHFAQTIGQAKKYLIILLCIVEIITYYNIFYNLSSADDVVLLLVNFQGADEDVAEPAQEVSDEEVKHDKKVN